MTAIKPKKKLYMTALYTSDGLSQKDFHIYTDLQQVKAWLDGVYKDFHTTLNRIPYAEWDTVEKDLKGRLKESAHEINGTFCLCHFLVWEYDADTVPNDGTLWSGAVFEEGKYLHWESRMVSSKREDIIQAFRVSIPKGLRSSGKDMITSALCGDDDYSIDGMAVRIKIETFQKQ